LKPNISRSVHDLVFANWSLTGDLARNKLDWIVDQKDTTTANKPTLLFQKGRHPTYDEGLPKGVLSYRILEVYVAPFVPTSVSGCTDQMWEMGEEVRRIIRANRTAVSGVERVTFSRAGQRRGGVLAPFRGNEVVVECFWRD